MTVRTASCPSCGAAVEFASAVSVMVVCAHCGTASVRRDVELEKLGRVAEVAPIDSVVSLGTAGRWSGRRFSVVGQVQLDHGKGPWNEWCLLFEDGETGWLAEAQGQLLVTFPRPDLVPQRAAGLATGASVTLGDAEFVVAEAGSARVVTARGELPQELRPGGTYRYFDLQAADGRFATVSIAADGTADLHLGWTVPRAELAIDESTLAREAPRRAAADRLACPSCASPIVLRDPASQRVVCSSCGSMMDPRVRTLRVIEKAKRLEARPAIPIGSRGRLRGDDMEVLAFLVRSVTVEKVRYPWTEYLLRRSDGGYRWLVCSSGHWSFVEPVNAGEVRRDPGTATWRGERFRHFQGGDAVVDHVQGEVYWEVRIGESVRSDDYVLPPRMLSFESSDDEIVVSVGHHVPRLEMAAAFPGVSHWPVPSGIAANQPNPWTRARRGTGVAALALAALLLVVMAFFHLTHANRVVARIAATAPAPTAAPASPAPGAATEPGDPGVAFSEEFLLSPASANVAIELEASVANSWLAVQGALVNLDTGDVHEFASEVGYWYGSEGGESWSEGSRSETVYLGSVPAGRYALRVDAEAPAPTPYTVTARSQVPSTWRGVGVLSLLLVPFLVFRFADGIFERRRWAQSDHGPGGGG